MRKGTTKSRFWYLPYKPSYWVIVMVMAPITKSPRLSIIAALSEMVGSFCCLLFTPPPSQAQFVPVTNNVNRYPMIYPHSFRSCTAISEPIPAIAGHPATPPAAGCS